MDGTPQNPIVIGCSPSPPPGRPHWNSPEAQTGYVDNEKSETEALITGNLSSDYPALSGLAGSRYLTTKLSQTFTQRLTASLQDLSQPKTTFGKTKPPFWERALSSAERAFNEIPPPIGRKSGNQQRSETLWQSQQISEFVIMAPCRESLQTSLRLLLSSVPQMFTGALQEQAKLGERGKRPVWMLTLKTLGPSGSVDIEVSHTLFSMSSGEPSIYRTFFDGWIVTRFVWKLRGLRDLSWPAPSGSQATFLQSDGTPISMVPL